MSKSSSLGRKGVLEILRNHPATQEALNWMMLEDSDDATARLQHDDNTEYCIFSDAAFIPKDVKVIELLEAELKGSLCRRCSERIAAKREDGTLTFFTSVPYTLIGVAKGMLLAEAEGSFKGIAQGLILKGAAVTALADLGHVRLPGFDGIKAELRANVESFDLKMKTFRESPKGQKRLLRMAANKLLNYENSDYNLLVGTQDSEDGVLREIGAFRKRRRKITQKLFESPMCSLYKNADFKEQLFAYADDVADEDFAFKRLMIDRWLDEKHSIICVPFIIGALLEISANPEPGYNLSQRPSERTLECMRAIGASESELSAKEIYLAALALD